MGSKIAPAGSLAEVSHFKADIKKSFVKAMPIYSGTLQIIGKRGTPTKVTILNGRLNLIGKNVYYRLLFESLKQ